MKTVRVRSAILRELRTPQSAAAVARTLGIPRQRLGHHVRALESAGLVRSVGERKVRNFTERVLQASAQAYLLHPDLLGALETDEGDDAIDRFSTATLLRSAARTLRDVGTMAAQSESEGKKIPTLAIERSITFPSFPRQREFAEQLSAAIDRLIESYGAPEGGGRRFRVAVAVHPLAE